MCYESNLAVRSLNSLDGLFETLALASDCLIDGKVISPLLRTGHQVRSSVPRTQNSIFNLLFHG